MKTIRPEERLTETEIILNDEKMDPIIRKLIAVALKRGYRKSNVAKALTTRWGELYDDPKPVFNPTSEELEFWKKAEKFTEMYRDLLIEAHDEDVETIRFKNQCNGDEEKEKRILRIIEIFLKAAYCAFCREDNIRKAYVEKYANLIERYVVTDAANPAKYVYKVIDSKLMYDKDNDFHPEKKGTKEGLIYLYRVKAVDEFCAQYKYTHTIFSNAMMAAI